MKTVKIPLTEEQFLKGEPFQLPNSDKTYQLGQSSECIRVKWGHEHEFEYVMNYSTDTKTAYAFHLLGQRVEFRLKFLKA